MTIRQKISRAISPFAYGCITGIVCGAVITMFLVCARIVITFAFDIYSAERTPLAVTCIFALVIMCCLFAAILQTLYPSSRGSGIPLSGATARGILRVRWLRNASALIVGSLISFASGLSLGGEGPSIGVGGLIGDGIGSIAKKPSEFRRHLVTGGSSAGLAVAFNAPLTGITFALEETHRRFSPRILLAAFSSVLPAVLTSQLLYWGLEQSEYLYGLGIRAGAAALHFFTQTRYESTPALLSACAIAIAAGGVCAVFAVSFNCATRLLGKIMVKISNPTVRLLPVFLLTAACGIALPACIGSGEATLAEISVPAATYLLVAILIVRFALTAAASGSGCTGGLFLPMLAIGGLIGALVAKGVTAAGFEAKYTPNIILLCIVAFYAGSVRAPISAVALSVELSASFANLLPCALAVSVATAIAGILRSEPLYERMTEELRDRTIPQNTGKTSTITGEIPPFAAICDRRIRDILWPYNSLVTALDRNGTEIVPDGETILQAGDKLTIRAENIDPTEFADQIKDYITILSE